jgi:uncharacterized membrane protein
MLKDLWNDLAPSKRCDWIDQLRGWAVIVMIEVHCVNVWLHQGMIPDWLNYMNGLVAPSFIMCAGYSLVLSTFRPDGTLRPFGPTAKRLGFILICAYALHAPGFTLAEWTVLSTPQKFRELFKIDVLQCIVFSLLILQGLARVIRKPMAYAFAALLLAVGAAWAAPHLWRMGVADGWWLPIRGLINGNTDRGVTALFPLFPWISFAAIGSVLGAVYRHLRVMPVGGHARWSEARWLVALAVVGALLLLWGSLYARTWMWSGTWPPSDAWRLHNTTLPSVAQRLGIVCMIGAALGWIEMVRGTWKGPNVVEAASKESLLLYMLHLNMIFGVLLVEPIRMRTGWNWYALGWTGTLTLTAVILSLNLAAGVAWQKVRQTQDLARKLQRLGLAVLGCWFLLGGWLTYFHFRKSPELATEPYPFLNAARVRKGLQPTPDGLSRDPEEYFREIQRRKMKLDPDTAQRMRQQIEERRKE